MKRNLRRAVSLLCVLAMCLTLLPTTALAAEIIPCAMALFQESYRWERPIRSIGVCLAALVPMGGDEQMCMFPSAGRKRMYELEGAVEDIRRRFGHISIMRASLIRDDIGAIDPKDDHMIFPEGRLRAASGGV